MPSAEVNSVMIRPHPPRLRMNRRKTVSVTPAMGASTVAGAISTPPIETCGGTGTAGVGMADAPVATGVSQYLRTTLFYRVFAVFRPSSDCLLIARFSGEVYAGGDSRR